MADDQDYEPDTPVSSEKRLYLLGKANADVPAMIKAARDALVNARKMLTSAKTALLVAKAKATLSPECPVMGRGPGEVAKAVQDSWIVMRTLDEREAIADAEAAVQIASANLAAANDHRKSLREQTMVATAIGASVRDSYRGTGGGRP